MSAGDFSWLGWEVDERGAGEWDAISGTLEGYWNSPDAARQALRGKRIALPGQATGYGFYTTDGGIKARYTRNGRVRVDLTAQGLFERKLKRTDFTTLESYTVGNVTVNGLGTPLPNGTYERLNFTDAKPSVEIVAAYLVTGTDFLSLSAAGTPITSHWAISATGGFPSVGSNPFTTGDFTFHYPNGWSFTADPGASLGALGNGTGYKLRITKFRFWHTWQYTL